jgi:hypothetical protein
MGMNHVESFWQKVIQTPSCPQIVRVSFLCRTLPP